MMMGLDPAALASIHTCTAYPLLTVGIKSLIGLFAHVTSARSAANYVFNRYGYI